MRPSIVRNLLASAAIAALSPSISFAQVKQAVTPPSQHAPDKPSDRQADQQAVPVKEVVLYTSGVGYFEHFGSVKGDGFTELHFKTDQINDILKSLLLEDLDGGKVSSVTYGSDAPLAHTLKSFEVDLSSAPPLNELLAQLRGASVTATLPQGVINGKILSVEKKTRPTGENKTIEVWVLNLLLSGGAIRPVDLDQVSEIKLDDAKLQQELVKALSAVSASRDQDSKPVSIHFTGQGDRRVRIGYVVEAPVWKASYRLVLTSDASNEKPPAGEAKPGPKPDQGAPAAPEPDAVGKGGEAAVKVGEVAGGKLQGWAIVENQTDNDWENVQLSLVSGRPISFIENLYQPLFVGRPVVEPELYASLRPQRYAESLMSLQEDRAADAEKVKDLKEEQKQSRRLAMAGAAPAAPAPAPFGAQQNMAFAKRAAMDPTASVSSMASGASVGEFFQYTVGDVTLPRQKSAMIPIITDSVKTTRLSIYNASVLPDHPLLGARLTNSTGKLLPQGPITVLDGGAYAGDATIGDLPNGQNRLLSYGIDQSLLIHNNDQTQSSALVTGRIVKGVLELTTKQVFHQVYQAQNKGKADRTLLIEHPRHGGWTLVQPAHAMETTDALYRFEETVTADKTTPFAVQEELISSQGIAILPMDVGQIQAYTRTAEIPDAVKKSLGDVAKLKYALVDTERAIQERQQSIAEITQEQNRIRENMKAVSTTSEYYQRLLKELDTQETQLQKLKTEIKDLQQKQNQQRKELEDSIANLSVG